VAAGSRRMVNGQAKQEEVAYSMGLRVCLNCLVSALPMLISTIPTSVCTVHITAAQAEEARKLVR
jgi:hypothetical protein